jgi:hypothetical protein
VSDDVEYDTLDEAIAAALAEIEPGGTLSIHSEACALRVEDEDEESCTCTPLVLKREAEA